LELVRRLAARVACGKVVSVECSRMFAVTKSIRQIVRVVID